MNDGTAQVRDALLFIFFFLLLIVSREDVRTPLCWRAHNRNVAPIVKTASVTFAIRARLPLVEPTANFFQARDKLRSSRVDFFSCAGY